ncbi:MAG TPA: c-type cytochrome [Thermoanaerobaculia bacterium]|nr:c-type cytochrome [Thermoanaerobaculia bacterium]
MANTLKLDHVLFAIAVVVLLTSCSSPETEEQPTGQKTAGKKQVGPTGQEIFESRCAFCHGVSGAGDTSVGRSFPGANLADGTWAHGGTPAEISASVEKGVPGTPMEGYKGLLTPDEITRVRDYIVTWKK